MWECECHSLNRPSAALCYSCHRPRPIPPRVEDRSPAEHAQTGLVLALMGCVVLVIALVVAGTAVLSGSAHPSPTPTGPAVALGSATAAAPDSPTAVPTSTPTATPTDTRQPTNTPEPTVTPRLTLAPTRVPAPGLPPVQTATSARQAGYQVTSQEPITRVTVNLPSVDDYACGAWMEYHDVQDGFFLIVQSSGGTSVMLGNASECVGTQEMDDAFIQKDNGDPMSFPAYGAITASVSGSSVSFSAHGVTKKISVAGSVYGLYFGYMTNISDAGPFKAATFSNIEITAGGRVGGLRTWWLSTTQYAFRGAQTHASASLPTSRYTKFTVTRYYDGP